MNHPTELPDHFYFGGGSSETIITPLVGVIVGIAFVLVLMLRRRHVIFPFLSVSVLIPSSEVVVLAGLHFNVLRLMIFCGLIRMGWDLAVAWPPQLKMTFLDKLFVTWAACNSVMYVLLWGLDAAANRAGFLLTTMGGYFVTRHLIRNRDDVVRTIKAFAVITIVASVGMWLEHVDAVNQFDWLLLGVISEVERRAGTVRAHGPFAHSIIAGTVGAVLVPLFVTLWQGPQRSRLLFLLGAAGATIMVFTAASSTPVMTLFSAICALCARCMRRHMRTLRWGIIAGLLGLQLMMTAPIWWIFARLSGVIGGSGWHRSELIDEFVRRPSEWWLIGTQNNADWGADTWDTINGFVRAGVDGGLLTLVLYIAIIVTGFKIIGRARKAAEGVAPDDETLIWAIGSSWFAQTVASFGIIYFDQSVIVWLILLAMIRATKDFMVEEAVDETDLMTGSAVSPLIGY